MRRSEPWTVGAAGVLLGLALVGIVAYEGRARASGEQVALAMNPPAGDSLLEAGYLELELVERLEAGAPCPPGTEGQADPFFSLTGGGTRRWIALRQAGEGAWRVTGQAETRRDARRFGPVLLRGRAGCRAGEVEIDVGVKRLHARRGEAEVIARRLRQAGGHRSYALISVGRDGRARLRGVQVGDQRVLFDWI